jgi:hypothetical protein
MMNVRKLEKENKKRSPRCLAPVRDRFDFVY